MNQQQLAGNWNEVPMGEKKQPSRGKEGCLSKGVRRVGSRRASAGLRREGASCRAKGGSPSDKTPAFVRPSASSGVR